MINPLIFKAYDIRGIYPTDINEENIIEITKAIYSFFITDLGKKTLSIVLGRDMRISSPSLFGTVKKTLIDMGANVIDVGLVSTPTFYFSVLHYKYDCGIQISASHNPKEYNGIKFVKRIGKSIIKIGKTTGMGKVKELALSKKFISGRSIGKLKTINNVINVEVKFALDLLKPIYIKKLKIVADPANAMGILYLEELFKKLPCQLIKMNFKLDGTFPSHQPDPLNFKNLKDLQKKVIEEKADLGIAPDGDGDRVFFIDEKGKIIKASLISSLIANEILKNHPREKIIIDVRYTRNISRVVERADGIPLIGKIGHALITEYMHRENAIFSGESSGHYFYRDTGFAESSVLTMLYLLEIMGRESKSISQIISKFQTSIESGEYNFVLNKGVDSKNLLNKIAQNYQNGQISWLDGIAIDYPSWRFNIRDSNTEPLLRLNVEGDSDNLVQEKLKEVSKKIIDIGAKPKE